MKLIAPDHTSDGEQTFIRYARPSPSLYRAGREMRFVFCTLCWAAIDKDHLPAACPNCRKQLGSNASLDHCGRRRAG